MFDETMHVLKFSAIASEVIFDFIRRLRRRVSGLTCCNISNDATPLDHFSGDRGGVQRVSRSALENVEIILGFAEAQSDHRTRFGAVGVAKRRRSRQLQRHRGGRGGGLGGSGGVFGGRRN